MPQDMTPGTITESERASGGKVLILVRMVFDSGEVRFWNGSGGLTFNGDVYTGRGDLGQVGPITTSLETRPFGFTLQTTGIVGTQDMIAKAESENIIGRPITVWVGYLDDDYALIADPSIEFQGRMDSMPISIGETLSVGITAESRLADWNKSNIRRFSDPDQRLDFPADDGYIFTLDSIGRTITWGGQPAGGVGGGPISSTHSAGLLAAIEAAGAG